MKIIGTAFAVALGFATIAPVVVSTPTTAVAAEAKQNFVLYNRTGFEVKEVYVSPSRSNDWEEDVLGQDILDDGDNVKIRFNRKTRTCKYDLKVVYAIDGSDAVWTDINLCEISKITIYYNKKNDSTTADFD